MPELGPYGSVRGALSNERPYRDLRNVVANYPFEKSLRFAGIQPNSRHRDYSRLSCGDGGYAARAECQDLSRDACADVGQSLRWQELPRFSARSKDDPAVAKPATPLLSLRWTLRAKRACVVITGTEPDRLSSSPPPAPMGLRGVWVVAARCCADPGAIFWRRRS